MSQSATATPAIPAATIIPDIEYREHPDGWRAQTVITQWDPEHQLVGALMHLPARKAEPILGLVPDTAIGRPLARWVYEVIRTLVEEGRDPDPVQVLCTAKHRPAVGALHPEQPVTAARHRAFAVYLADAYTQTVSPTAAQAYAREVLDGAYRRAFGEHGIRMQQMAESGASRADLTDQFTLIRDELAHLWRRCQVAATPGWDTP